MGETELSTNHHRRERLYGLKVIHQPHGEGIYPPLSILLDMDVSGEETPPTTAANIQPHPASAFRKTSPAPSSSCSLFCPHTGFTGWMVPHHPPPFATCSFPTASSRSLSLSCFSFSVLHLTASYISSHHPPPASSSSKLQLEHQPAAFIPLTAPSVQIQQQLVLSDGHVQLRSHSQPLPTSSTHVLATTFCLNLHLLLPRLKPPTTSLSVHLQLLLRSSRQAQGNKAPPEPPSVAVKKTTSIRSFQSSAVTSTSASDSQMFQPLFKPACIASQLKLQHLPSRLSSGLHLKSP